MNCLTLFNRLSNHCQLFNDELRLIINGCTELMRVTPVQFIIVDELKQQNFLNKLCCLTCKQIPIKPWVYQHVDVYCEACKPPLTTSLISNPNDWRNASSSSLIQTFINRVAIQCVSCQCQLKMQEMSKHIFNDCTRLIECACKQMFKLTQFFEHQKSCLIYQQIQCPYAVLIRELHLTKPPISCSWSGSRDELQQHFIQTGCLKLYNVAQYYLSNNNTTQIQSVLEQKSTTSNTSTKPISFLEEKSPLLSCLLRKGMQPRDEQVIYVLHYNEYKIRLKLMRDGQLFVVVRDWFIPMRQIEDSCTVQDIDRMMNNTFTTDLQYSTDIGLCAVHPESDHLTWIASTRFIQEFIPGFQMAYQHDTHITAYLSFIQQYLIPGLTDRLKRTRFTVQN
jgi:hypothetical protein